MPLLYDSGFTWEDNDYVVTRSSSGFLQSVCQLRDGERISLTQLGSGGYKTVYELCPGFVLKVLRRTDSSSHISREVKSLQRAQDFDLPICLPDEVLGAAGAFIQKSLAPAITCWSDARCRLVYEFGLRWNSLVKDKEFPIFDIKWSNLGVDESTDEILIHDCEVNSHNYLLPLVGSFFGERSFYAFYSKVYAGKILPLTKPNGADW